MSAVITGKNIVKTFGGANVLNKVDAEIEKGEFVAVMGPSGSEAGQRSRRAGMAGARTRVLGRRQRWGDGVSAGPGRRRRGLHHFHRKSHRLRADAQGSRDDHPPLTASIMAMVSVRIMSQSSSSPVIARSTTTLP